MRASSRSERNADSALGPASAKNEPCEVIGDGRARVVDTRRLDGARNYSGAFADARAPRGSGGEGLRVVHSRGSGGQGAQQREVAVECGDAERFAVLAAVYRVAALNGLDQRQVRRARAAALDQRFTDRRRQRGAFEQPREGGPRGAIQ